MLASRTPFAAFDWFAKHRELARSSSFLSDGLLHVYCTPFEPTQLEHKAVYIATCYMSTDRQKPRILREQRRSAGCK